MFASLIAAMLLLAQTAWHANCPDVTAADFNSGRYDGQCVRLHATVIDAFVDATNADYVFLVLRCADGCVYAFIKRDFLSLPPERLVGAEVAPCGCVRAPPNSPQHRQAQRLFDIPQRDTFVVTRPAPGIAEQPDLATAESCRPDELPALGRRSVRGVVAVGFPETDLQNLNLSRAVWQTQTNRVDVRRPAPRAIAFTDLLRDIKGRRAINCAFHGRPVSFTATVRSRIDEEPSGRFFCGDARENVTIDLSASSAPHPDLRVGDTVRVTGVAILDIDNCRPSAAFPQARGYVVVPTSADGLAVVARARHPLPPSAWYVLGALLASILGVGIWNRSLRRLAQMRGKDLAREEIARAEADLRTGERMRIAADLHDALSQSLTGVALEVEAALRTDRRNDAARAAHLARAGATLASCREELRNCLWDLRSAAMDEADMNEAVRRTLLPHIRGIALSVRFNVSRRRLSDFTVHTLLCIIRELAVNAIRHGGATRLQVAGTIRGGRLFVSVRDDGCGFDPATAPGVTESHFGLQGVRERISNLAGVFTLVRRPRGGMRATVELSVPQAKGGT